jgi:hypothetical protein
MCGTGYMLLLCSSTECSVCLSVNVPIVSDPGLRVITLHGNNPALESGS